MNSEALKISEHLRKEDVDNQEPTKKGEAQGRVFTWKNAEKAGLVIALIITVAAFVFAGLMFGGTMTLGLEGWMQYTAGALLTTTGIVGVYTVWWLYSGLTENGKTDKQRPVNPLDASSKPTPRITSSAGTVSAETDTTDFPGKLEFEKAISMMKAEELLTEKQKLRETGDQDIATKKIVLIENEQERREKIGEDYVRQFEGKNKAEIAKGIAELEIELKLHLSATTDSGKTNYITFEAYLEALREFSPDSDEDEDEPAVSPEPAPAKPSSRFSTPPRGVYSLFSSPIDFHDLSFDESPSAPAGLPQPALPRQTLLERFPGANEYIAKIAKLSKKDLEAEDKEARADKILGTDKLSLIIDERMKRKEKEKAYAEVFESQPNTAINAEKERLEKELRRLGPATTLASCHFEGAEEQYITAEIQLDAIVQLIEDLNNFDSDEDDDQDLKFNHYD